MSGIPQYGGRQLPVLQRIKGRFFTIKAVFVFLFVICTAFSANSNERIEVYVVDQLGRPVEGASVSFTCNFDDFRNTVNVTRELRQTDENGFSTAAAVYGWVYCSLLKPTNAEVTYEGQVKSVSGTWRKGTNKHTVMIPDLFDLKINIKDQDTEPIEDAAVRATPVQGGGVTQRSGKTNNAGQIVFDQIPQGTEMLVFLKNGDEEQTLKTAIYGQTTEIDAKMKAFDLEVGVFDQDRKPLSKSSVAIKSETYSSTSETNISGKVIFERLKPAQYTYDVKFGRYRQSQTITLDQDKSVVVLFGEKKEAPAQISSNLSDSKNLSTSSKWFKYLMSETDALVEKHKQAYPKFKIVFVPIGFAQNQSQEFKKLAAESAKRFLEVSPLRECSAPSAQIESLFLEPYYCNISSCSDICGAGTNTSEDCQTLVKDCAEIAFNTSVTYQMAVGLCRNTSCGGSCGGCAASIPSKTVVVNSDKCGAVAPRIVTHEMGHGFGLYHVRGPLGVNGCWDNEGGACQLPNAADCNESAADRSNMIMPYCPSMEKYGPAAYTFLKNNVFKGYLEVCK